MSWNTILEIAGFCAIGIGIFMGASLAYGVHVVREEEHRERWRAMKRGWEEKERARRELDMIPKRRRPYSRELFPSYMKRLVPYDQRKKRGRPRKPGGRAEKKEQRDRTVNTSQSISVTNDYDGWVIKKTPGSYIQTSEGNIRWEMPTIEKYSNNNNISSQEYFKKVRARTKRERYSVRGVHGRFIKQGRK